MNKKKLGGFLGALAGIAAAIVAAKQPHNSPPRPDWPTAAILGEWKGTCRAVVTEQAHRDITEPELTDCLARAKAGAQAVDLRTWADGLPKPEPPPVVAPPVVALAPLAVSGKVFTANGQPVRWKGVSSFALLDRFARGEDISDVLTAYQGYNVLRVWPYVPRADWGAKAWDQPNADVVVAFLAAAEKAGFYVEITLLTDDSSARIPSAAALLSALAAARPRNLVIEVANEPTTHKNINTAALKSAAMASGFLVSSGNYEDTRLFYGHWIGFHSGRDQEWPRRAHDAIDYWQGGGPDFPEEPAVRVPSVCDEPIRPDQAGYNAQDFRAYFGSCALMSAGGTYHTETGKFGLPPTPEEARIAAVVLDALNAFPADAANGSYRRIDESGRSLRTYVIGERYMVRVRPTTKDAPEAGWTALDDGDGILWRKQ